MIPVYKIKIPEYKVRKFKTSSKTKRIQFTPWFGIKIPQIYEDKKPDFAKIGAKVDRILKKHFLGKKVAIRVLSSSEHKGKSADELIKIIKKIGHDKYDPKRKGDRYENVEGKKIDFFALDYTVKKNGEYFRYLIEPFYYWPIHDRGRPLRADIAIIYDLSKLKRILHQYKGREGEIKKDGFVFKDQENKSDAILGIIKIL
jgi:hypothetical protein